MIQRFIPCTTVIAVAVVIGQAASTVAPAAAAATPSLTFDLRLRSTGGKEIEVANVGEQFVLDLYAICNGVDADTTNDTLSFMSGAFRSLNGGMPVDLLGLAPPAPFNSAFITGGQTDVDVDGDFDVGGLNPFSGTGFYTARAQPPPPRPQPAGGFFVGSVSVTVNALNPHGTEVDWFHRDNLVINSLAYFDGSPTPMRLPASSMFSTGPVVIRTAGPDPEPIEYLSGTIDTHVTATNRVRAATASPGSPGSPGSPVLLTRGLNVTANGQFDMRGPGGYGTHRLLVNDDTSGNAGGALFIGAIDVGDTEAGVFTHSGGVTNVPGRLTVGAGAAGTLTISGGNLSAGRLVAGASSPGVVHQQAGIVVAPVLEVAASTGAAGSSYRIDSGALRVSEPARIGIAGAGSYQQTGGDVKLMLDMIVAPTAGIAGRLDFAGGTFTAHSMKLGQAGNATVVQSGGSIALSLDLELTPIVAPTVAGILPQATYTIDDGALTVARFLRVGRFGAGRVVQNAGAVSADVLEVYNDRSNSLSPPGSARYEMNGGTLSAEGIAIGGGITPGIAGSMEQTGGAISTADFHLSSQGTFRMSGGTLRASNHFAANRTTIDLADAPVTIRIAGKQFTHRLGAPINAKNATIIVEDGSLLSFQKDYDPIAQIGSIITDGLIHVEGQPMFVPPGKRLDGSVDISAAMTNSGTVSPGASPGKITVAGAYTQDDAGILAMEIAGRASAEFDLLEIDGAAMLDGDLAISLLDGFVPAGTDSFRILTAASVSGGFDNVIDGRIEFTGGRFDVSYGSSSLTLSNFSAVPEPAGATLLALGLATALRRSRRRRRLW